MAVGGFFLILSAFGRDEGPEGRGGAAAANGGRDAVASGRGAAPDAVDAAPAIRMLWRSLEVHGAVRGAGGVARARLAVYGKGRRRNGYGGVCTEARHARRRGGGPGCGLEPWRAAGRSMTWTVERSFVRIR